MVRTIVIDSVQSSIDHLTELFLEHFNESIQLLPPISDFQNGLAALEKIQPDLAFINVASQRGKIFKYLEGLKKRNFEVVFYTADNKFAANAVQLSALDYIVKPALKEDIFRVLGKLKNIKNLNNESGFSKVLSNVKSPDINSQKLAIPASHGYDFIKISDIVRCESDVNYTYMFLLNGQKLVISKNLKEYEDMLTPYNFDRINHSHLININYISKFLRNDGGYVVMEDKKKIGISRRRKARFLEKLFQTSLKLLVLTQYFVESVLEPLFSL